MTLTKKVNGVDYALLPNSRLYVFPIPDQEIVFHGLNRIYDRFFMSSMSSYRPEEIDPGWYGSIKIFL
ncbi:hypothetical protein [Pedobacter sp. R-06]|uniref:hypothetical protein n=1 Tax=Pedobacter sp. R-06 TaxID=3404051 RepID=UPI003CF6538C